METAFIVYGLCASALLWSTLPHRRRHPAPPEPPSARIEYFLISPALLDLWRTNSPNLIIFDLRETTALPPLPGALRVRSSDLPALLSWLPPCSVLVLSLAGPACPLPSSAETALLHLGIDMVFFLENTSKLRPEAFHVQPAWLTRTDALASNISDPSGDRVATKIWRYFP